MSNARLRIGRVWMDAVSLPQALDRVVALCRLGKGGAVFTPNVDHIVLTEDSPALRQAYQEVELSLVDGMPVFWASRFLGLALPEKISGSDFVLPLCARAAREGLSVYCLGGAPGAAEEAAARLIRETGVKVAGFSAPRIGLGPEDHAHNLSICQEIRRAAPDLLLVALGCPKQEIWIHRYRSELAPAVSVGVGAGLDFLSGKIKRAPRWMSRAGLEWMYRLLQEPRRLWRRYLVNDPRFLGIMARTLCEPKEARVRRAA